jgi:phospholipid/cholesterol/gamma-HCH transport system substrate-binding protein
MPLNRLIGLGLFVLLGIGLFAVALFTIGERRFLFARTFDVLAEFQDVSGLLEGAPVRVAGMEAGEVRTIAVPTAAGEPFRVRLQIREDLSPLVRNDSVATIRTQGIVGGMFVHVTSGTEAAPPAADGTTILSREPFDIADLLDQAGDTIRTINDTIVALRADVERTIAVIAETAQNADALIDDVGEDVRRIAAAGTTIAETARVMVEDVRAGRGTIGRLIAEDDIYVSARNIAGEAERTMEAVRDAAEQTRRIVAEFRAEEGPAGAIAADLRVTLGNASDAMVHLSENLEALKRSWPFRGFFRERGYFDLDQISPMEYREGVLERGGRMPLRIWLASEVLFETYPDRPDVLTEGGRARLDSAMGQFLPYLEQGPIMVEGYSTATTRDQQFIEGNRRARIARRYLTDRFGLDPTGIGSIALGAEAPGSPLDGRWDGVAVTIYVPAAVVRQR